MFQGKFDVNPISGTSKSGRNQQNVKILRILVFVVFLCALVAAWSLFFKYFDGTPWRLAGEL
jgi:hypothetical protein